MHLHKAYILCSDLSTLASSIRASYLSSDRIFPDIHYPNYKVHGLLVNLINGSGLLENPGLNIL